MQPAPNRLVRRAHHCFAPRVALWQHFVAPRQPFLPHERQSSTTTAAEEPVHDDYSPSTDSGRTRDYPATRHTSRRVLYSSQERKEWYLEQKRRKKLFLEDARGRFFFPQTSLLAEAKEAFDARQDYEGVVIAPVAESHFSNPNLPWELRPEERTMEGMDRLRIEMKRFCKNAKPNPIETFARQQLIELLRKHTRENLPDHILEVIGSERTGLSFATSDIDLRLVTNTFVAGNLPSKPQRRRALADLKLLCQHNLKHRKDYLDPKILRSRYPLISLQHQSSGIHVQIVLSNDSSRSRELTATYLKQYPYLRELYFVVRAMLNGRGLCDTYQGGFNSYTLFMMIVASIKLHPHPRNDSAGALLNFLEFYANPKTTNQGIVIEPVAKTFDKAEHFIMSSKAKVWLDLGVLKPLPPYMLCLQDPADEQNDLGRKVAAIKHGQATFLDLYLTLSKDVEQNTRASILSYLVESSYLLDRQKRETLQSYGRTMKWAQKNMMGDVAETTKIFPRTDQDGSKE